MAMTDLRPLLADARKHRYAIPAFDVSNDEMVRAVMEVCVAERSPAIFMLLKPDMQGMARQMLVNMIRTADALYDIPVCIHLDHATSFEDIAAVIDAGATSVMYDGSSLPYAENLEGTKRVVDYAHALGISVEAELGHVTDAIAGSSETGEASSGEMAIEDCLTDPEQVRHFVEATGVDCLAVAVGTAHGVYVSTPTLHFERLRAIEAASPCPLVLHGGSGTPDAEVRKAIALGITKINIFSEVLAAMNSGLKEKLQSIENVSAWPSVVWQDARVRMREVIRNKIRTFGSNGRA